MYWTEFKREQKTLDNLMKLRTCTEDGEKRRLEAISKELRKMIDIAEELYKEIERRQNQ